MDAGNFAAPSTGPWPRQRARLRLPKFDIEQWLEVQRDQLPLWIPVAFGAGIAAWFGLPARDAWGAWLVGCATLAVASLTLPAQGRARRALMIAVVAASLGMTAAWWRAVSVATPVLTRPVVVTFSGTIDDVELQVAKERVRVTLRPDAAAELPPKVRAVIDMKDAPPGLVSGDRVSMRARLVGPPTSSVPGGYDFSRTAWFMRLGATGKAIGPVTRLNPAQSEPPTLRERLSAHVRAQISGSAGGIAAAFASGDRGGIAPEDEDAMRASGLTHLLSISGLHVTAVVGAAMLLTLRLLALSRWLALRLPLIMVSAGAGAAAGVGYTLLTGAEVPTVRSCVAALLILVGVAIGRQAFTLRLVATGALVVMLLWPEAVVGPSFQLSFAAITSIVALHEWGPLNRLLAARDEGWLPKGGRFVLSLLATGIAVEVALAPIALYHFHRQGLYGALANIVAIPLTTFVTMPMEALALLFDSVGLGGPFWWLTGQSLELLLWIARHVAAWPGAVAALASVPVGAFLIIITGGLWLMLWKGRVRLLGFAPIAFGAVWTLLTPPPDLLVTGDGMHLALRGDDGRLATLRPRAGDYVRSVMGERFGDLGELADLDTLSGAQCTDDVCRVDVTRGGRAWRIVATRSRYLLPYASFKAECAAADIVVSDRRLPPWCEPKWLRADRDFLTKTGGLAVTLGSARVETVAQGEGDHPWVAARHVGKAKNFRVRSQQPPDHGTSLLNRFERVLRFNR